MAQWTGLAPNSPALPNAEETLQALTARTISGNTVIVTPAKRGDHIVFLMNWTRPCSREDFHEIQALIEETGELGEPATAVFSDDTQEIREAARSFLDKGKVR